jgi:hypothetical protein
MKSDQNIKQNKLKKWSKPSIVRLNKSSTAGGIQPSYGEDTFQNPS